MCFQIPRLVSIVSLFSLILLEAYVKHFLAAPGLGNFSKFVCEALCLMGFHRGFNLFLIIALFVFSFLRPCW